jgi:hypothetical protein
MAKIIAYISASPLLGTDLTLEKFKASFANYNTFEDVDAGHWASGVIGYDKHTGIVDGVDGVHFNPEREVKKIEAAKMCLVVLGYDAETEGLVGSDWFGNTMNLGLVKGLFDGIDTTDVNAPITRDEMVRWSTTCCSAHGRYIEVNGDLHEILALDQVNDLAKIYGNNFNFCATAICSSASRALSTTSARTIASPPVSLWPTATPTWAAQDEMGFQASTPLISPPDHRLRSRA